MPKLDTKHIIRRALEDAIAWNESLIDSIGKNDPHSSYVQNEIDAFRALLKRRYGMDLTTSEKSDADFMKTAKIINIIPGSTNKD